MVPGKLHLQIRYLFQQLYIPFPQWLTELVDSVTAAFQDFAGNDEQVVCMHRLRCSFYNGRCFTRTFNKIEEINEIDYIVQCP